MKLIWNTVRDAWSLAHLRGENRLAPDGTKDDDGEAGMATAEYAIGTLAAAAFAEQTVLLSDGRVAGKVSNPTTRSILTALEALDVRVGIE